MDMRGHESSERHIVYDVAMSDRPTPALGYAAGVVVVSVSTLTAWFLFGQRQLADVVMVFLLGVVIVSMRFGYGPSLLAAVLSVVCFEFFFIPPLFSFAVSDLRHIVTFAVMFTVALVVSHLTKRIRDQADAARRRESNTASLYALSREIGITDSREALLESAARHVREVFHANVAVFLPVRGDEIRGGARRRRVHARTAGTRERGGVGVASPAPHRSGNGAAALRRGPLRAPEGIPWARRRPWPLALGPGSRERC